MPSLVRVEPTWRSEAACRSADASPFYPPSRAESKEDRRARETAARALCARCPVRTPCLDYALYVKEPYGIWGGLTEIERRRLVRDRDETALLAAQ